MAKGCGYYRGQFAPYIGGGLPQEERRDLARHLRGCPSCTEAFGLEWRAFLGAASSPRNPGEVGEGAPERTGERRGRLLLYLLPLLVVAIFFLGSQRAGNHGAGARKSSNADLMQATRGLLEAQTHLLDSLVSVARQRQAPVSREVRFQALQSLEQARQALEVHDRELLEARIHPRFRLTAWTRGGLVERSMDREQVLGNPGLAKTLLDLSGRTQIRWWSSEEESVTLFLMDEAGGDGALLVLLQDEQESFRLFWAQVSALGF